jgi:hypothetical protein
VKADHAQERYVALYEGGALNKFGIPDKHFDAKIGAMCRWPRTTPEKDSISGYSFRQARESLDNFAEPVLNYMNWIVAHRTSATPKEVTWGDVFKTMNRFDTYAWCYNLITASTWAGRYPTPQYNWRRPFEMPWITSDFKGWEPPKEAD